MIEVKHPFIKLLINNFANFVGEDIELANRALSQATASERGRTEVSTVANTSLLHLG